jgi:2-amino-4-hydroxy-6-hydroxymethyldihydropteridine diphosphokinase
MTDNVFLILGSNKGNRSLILGKAVTLIGEMAGEVTGRSSVYTTEPWGFDSPGYFLNQVVRIETELTPEELLRVTARIEQMCGRERTGIKYESRTLDIDILYFSNHIINSGDLVIPHPMRAERRFVLVPMAEIDAGFTDPVLNKPVSLLLAECRDDKLVIPADEG